MTLVFKVLHVSKANHMCCLQLATEAYHASGRCAQAVAEALLDQAQKQRSKDDVSVIAVVFGGHCNASTG